MASIKCFFRAVVFLQHTDGNLIPEQTGSLSLAISIKHKMNLFPLSAENDFRRLSGERPFSVSKSNIFDKDGKNNCQNPERPQHHCLWERYFPLIFIGFKTRA
jgi:hypothetical protein